MTDHQLLDLIAPSVEQGQLRFADELRRLVHTDAPETFARLDFDSDTTFLEPLAFAYAARGVISPAELAVVYAAAMTPEKRPGRLSATTDADGRVFLPGSGYLAGLPPGSQMELVREDASPVGYSCGRSPIQAIPLRAWRLGDAPLSLLAYPVAALANAVGVAGGRLPGVDIAPRTHRPTLTTALRRLRDTSSELAAATCGVVRYVVLFDDPARNSFATTAAHGVVFLNVAHGTSEAFFIEDLVHQGGHVLFTAAWNGSEPLVTSAPDTSIGELTGEEDHRSLEVALHGMFTQTLMVDALEGLLGSDADVDRHEATGRLLFALLRLGLDLRALAGLSIYTEAGMRLVRELISAYAAAAVKFGDSLLAADFADQPYNFDYAVYQAHNPVPRSLART